MSIQKAVCLKGYKMPTQLYFAYGSNLNIADFERWCIDRGYPTQLLKFVGNVSLRDYELAFSYDSASRGGGVLDIRERRGSVVPGVIFEVAEAGWKALDRKEGARVPGCYQREHVVVFDESGEMHRATTYRVSDDWAQSYVVPAPGYVEVVQQGFKAWELNDTPLLAAARGESLPCPDGFFVYGTLMRGESRFEVLERYGIECVLLAETQGQLFDLGLFPGMTHDATSGSEVRGEFVRLQNPEAALAALDVIEGFRGYGKPDSLYRREQIAVHVGDGRIRRAWAYFLEASADDSQIISSGDWRQHCGSRELFLQCLVKAHSRKSPQAIAERLASMSPYNWNGQKREVVESLLPLEGALGTGLLSERKLAQASGQWTVIP
jgi:gamma-glutamylcyclotransferase (GGCT)/AIG2-like uncharacterized protein YtfP